MKSFQAPQAEDLSQDPLLRDAKRDEQGRPLLGGIPLLAKIGQGAKCAAYYGLHPILRKAVAVKILLSMDDPDAVKRFVREGRTAARISNPHLVWVFDANQERGLCYLVQEYVSGPSAEKYLDQVIAETGTGLSEREALVIVTAATRGAAAAHDKGVVHRDVNPRNILIPSASSGDGFSLSRAKLSDLGTAKVNDGLDLTGAGVCLGTPGYMAPEQIQSARDASFPADVFGLGATAYRLLTGHAPFTGPSAMSVLIQTLQKEHTPIGKYRDELSPATTELIATCLSKDPDDRYADAQELLTALESLPGA